MNRDNSVIWYVISLGVSMSYLPVKGIQYMINQERIVAVDPLLYIWQAVAIGFSLIALVNRKSKADFTISIMSLIFAVVFAVKFVHTPIMFLVKKVPDMGKLVLIIFLVIIFTVDMIVTLKNLIGIKKSLGQLDLIAEELNNIGNQIKDVVGNSAIDMADKAEQAKDELGKSGNEYIEKLIEKKDELGKSGNEYIEKLIEKKDELGKSGNGYIEKLKARKAELEKSSSGYVNNINKYRKHIFNTLPTLNKSGKSIKILEYIKDIIESKEDKKEDKSDS